MDQETPVFLLAVLNVTDMASFQAGYVGPLKAINERHRVETVVATPKLAALEGAPEANVIAILRFPSQDVLDTWYADPDYQPLLAARQSATDTRSSYLVSLTQMA